ncbi:unnamed protein product [Phyllotreta striolata]|uniref:Coiled-coil domain-containing protein 181 n=1 Tax=Phyllotreta striolata TaxID=444603 RepID=A0A9N9XTA5_PHYSR|nr:unnamed protein product [Phyllotreta striolata]
MDSPKEQIPEDTQSQIEEDVDCFFLQPSSSPYNIAEKVQQANIDLFSSYDSRANDAKTPKVKFKNDLFSFEPDLTDEDVNSIESDRDENSDTQRLIFEYKTVNIPNIEELPEDTDDEEIIESINADINEVEVFQKPRIKEERIEETKPVAVSNKTSTKKNKRSPKKLHNVKQVQCKNHCIDKLDFDLPMLISKLEIHEKYTNEIPPLQLLQRKCCDELRQKVQRNLPNYNGLKSEYGLTSRQIETKRKQQELSKLREENRKRILEEYKRRKIQQNEQVFCQWLKEISKRRQEKEREKQKRQRRTKERPKTANEIPAKVHVKKIRRPHTSTCVFFGMPRNFSSMIANANNNLSTRLHILTLS